MKLINCHDIVHRTNVIYRLFCISRSAYEVAMKAPIFKFRYVMNLLSVPVQISCLYLTCRWSTCVRSWSKQTTEVRWSSKYISRTVTLWTFNFPSTNKGYFPENHDVSSYWSLMAISFGHPRWTYNYVAVNCSTF